MDFYHLHHNLYIVQLKTIKDIEDLYPQHVVNTVKNNRIFESVYKKQNTVKKSWDESKFYSKKYFYENVVRPNKDTIDFRGFSRYSKHLTTCNFTTVFIGYLLTTPLSRLNTLLLDAFY